MNAPDGRDEDFTPTEVTECSRVLGAMTPAHRRMVRRLVRVLSLAFESPRAPRRPRLAPLAVEPIEPIEPVSPEACDDAPADDLTRAAARRILAAHGRRDGAA